MGPIDLIRTRRDNSDIELLEILPVFFESSQLPAAVRSPMAAVKQDHSIATLKLVRQGNPAPISKSQRKGRESRPNSKFLGHAFS